MKSVVRCCLLVAFAWAAFRHVGSWPEGAAPSRAAGSGLWGALSFALAAVIDRDGAR